MGKHRRSLFAALSTAEGPGEEVNLPGSHSGVSDAVRTGTLARRRSRQSFCSPQRRLLQKAKKHERLPFPHPNKEFQRAWDTSPAALPLGWTSWVDSLGSEPQEKVTCCLILVGNEDLHPGPTASLLSGSRPQVYSIVARAFYAPLK